MSNRITNFYPGTTKKFTITCKINGIAQDITSDTVTFYLKTKKADSDAEAVLIKVADVTTQGADGVAIFDFPLVNTAEIAPNNYYCAIIWELAGGSEYVVYDDKIVLLERVDDV